MWRAIVGRGACALTLVLLVGTISVAGATATPADASGAVLGWGSNNAHELSDGTTVNRTTPVEVQGLPEEAVGLAAVGGGSAALLRGGRVMTWGENLDDLGSGTEGPSLVPALVCAVGATQCAGGPYLEGVGSISGGGEFYLALLHDGSIVSWGHNGSGQLGNGFGIQTRAQQPVCTVREWPCAPAHELKGVTAVAAGRLHSLALLEDGTVLAWGENGVDQLGVKKTAVKCPLKGIKCSTVPIPVPGLSEVTAIAAGYDFSLALTRRGTVMAWGSNVYGTLGNGRNKPKVAAPAPVCAFWVKTKCKGELSEVAAIAVDEHTAFAVMRDGTVRSWGLNVGGLLGIGTSTGPQTCAGYDDGCSRAPMTVAGLGDVRAMSSGPRSQTAIAQLQDDTFVTWGVGGSGALGDGEPESSPVPVHVCAPFAAGPCPEGPYLTGAPAALAAGGGHMLVAFPAE